MEQAVQDEYKKGFDGRWGAGLPGSGDMQMLFLQSAVDKMDEHLGRAAIIENGSPLFSGGTSSGESQIRRWMLENDLIEAIIALPVEPENPLRTAEMTLEDDYGMIDGVLNNGRKGEELEKAQGEARRTTPEKKPSIRERLAEAKRECGERKPPDKTQQKKPEHDCL